MTDQFWVGVLLGWFAGAGFVLATCWRRLTGWHAREARRLRIALEDSDRQLSGQFAAADRMARMLAEEVGKRMR